MMEAKEMLRRLSLFGIPRSDSCAVRAILARLVAAKSLSLGELQTARDVMERSGCENAEAYLLLAAMFVSRRGGNAYLRAGRGEVLLREAGYVEDSVEGMESNDEYAGMVRSAWNGAVAAAAKLDGDVVAKSSGADGDRWFFQKDFADVAYISDALSERSSESNAEKPLDKAELAAATGFEGFVLNEKQVEAVKSAVANRFTVVTGGPGTGKTTVVCAIVRALMARGTALDEIALAAPTGRAAQRMGEALRDQCAKAKDIDADMRRKIESLDGSTIHSLLGGRPPAWKFTEKNRLPVKLAVVDESSMVDLHLMKSLVAALPDDCRLVLLGDKDQLPSVETGAVLGDMVGMKEASFVVHLSESKRFTEEFAKCADAVNAGDADGFAKASAELSAEDGAWLDSFDGVETENRCFRCVPAENAKPSVCQARFVEWATHFGLLEGGRLAALASDARLKDDEELSNGIMSKSAKAIFAELDRSRILTVVREGPYGVEGINELLLKARFGARLPFNPLLKAGIPVMVLRNTPARNLWNGDVGVTVEGRSGMTVLFPRGDKVVSCPVGLLPDHELAYAMTVHKSQGSEFENVMLVLPDDENHPLLNRQIVYTGITRAKKRAVVVGTRSALAASLERKLERDTGICPVHGEFAGHNVRHNPTSVLS